MILLFVLLIVFQIKHYICDYKYQTEYMLGKFKLLGWVIPLAVHCMVHATATIIISYICTQDLKLSVILSIFDFTAHFIMDRIKASPNMLGKYKAISPEKYITLRQTINIVEKVGSELELEQAKDEYSIAMEDNRNFWLSLGIDQMVHHLTHYVIIFLILKDLI